jgi:hypothetical protein
MFYMPVEIRELTIKVTVHDPGDGAPGTSSETAPDDRDIQARETLIKAAVQQTLDILDKRQER